MELPAWADKEQIAIAEQLFSRFAPQIALLLNFKALPLCYACKNGAKVLAATKRLVEANGKDTRRVSRRLFETSLMVMNVMSEGGLSKNGKGIITIKKVRLYHAAIRIYLLKYSREKWDVNEFGMPINQEEMAGTLMAFSALIINGLEELGAKLSDREKDAYMHCWKIVGYYIGLDSKITPNNYTEGWNLGIEIIKNNKSESEYGKILTTSLVEFSNTIICKNALNKILFSNLSYYMIQKFTQNVSMRLNDDIAKLLEADKKLNKLDKFFGNLFTKIINYVTVEVKDNLIFRRFYSYVATRFLQGMINKHLRPSEKEFMIPPSLKESWRMN